MRYLCLLILCAWKLQLCVGTDCQPCGAVVTAEQEVACPCIHGK